MSALKLTHHRMRDLGQQRLNLGSNEPPEGLKPITGVGSGQLQDKQKLCLAEIIAVMNDLFEGDITDGDTVTYVKTLKEKLLESDSLRAQAAANTTEQFSNSPSLDEELVNAVIDAMNAHQSMSRQALNSDEIRARILTTLLGPGDLWGALRSSRAPD